MKKYISVFLLFCFFSYPFHNAFAKDNNEQRFCSASCLIAEKDKIPHNIKIKKKKGLYGVINKDTGEVLIPFKYYEIKPLGVDTVKVLKHGRWEIVTNNNITVMKDNNFSHVAIEAIDKNKPKDISNSMYIGLYYANELKARIFIPGNPASDFLKQVYENNNKLSWLKFHNYPNNGTLIFKYNDKYGYLTTNGEYYDITFPYYEKFYIADSNSAMYRQFHISYLPLNRIYGYTGSYWDNMTYDPNRLYSTFYMFDVNVKEKLEIKNNEVHLTYVSSSPFNKKYINYYQNSFSLDSLDLKNLTYGDGVSSDVLMTYFAPNKNLKKLYEEINALSFIKFLNFPDSGLHLTLDDSNNYGLIIYDDKRGNKVIPNEYSQFYFQDSNSFIYKFLNLSFSNTDRIITKKNNKWGIINSDNEIVTDFQYDFITGMSAQNDFDINYDASGIYIKNKDIIFPGKNLFLVYKDNLCGVINENGEVIIPLKELYSKENFSKIFTDEDAEVLKKAMYTAQKTKNSKEIDFSVGGITHGTLKFVHTFCILIPAWTVGSIFWPFILAGSGNPIVHFFFDEMQ